MNRLIFFSLSLSGYVVKVVFLDLLFPGVRLFKHIHKVTYVYNIGSNFGNADPRRANFLRRYRRFPRRLGATRTFVSWALPCTKFILAAVLKATRAVCLPRARRDFIDTFFRFHFPSFDTEGTVPGVNLFEGLPRTMWRFWEQMLCPVTHQDLQSHCFWGYKHFLTQESQNLY